MSNLINKLRGLFRGIHPQADIGEFCYPRHRTNATDQLAVLMVTHRWTAS